MAARERMAKFAGQPGRVSPVTDAVAVNAARTEAILEAAVDAILSIDGRGIVQMINPAGVRLFGYASEEIIGQNVKVLMPAPYREEHDGYLARYLATGEKRIIGIGREALGRKKDGTVFPLDLSVAEAIVGGERFFVGIIRDISRRKEAETALHDGKAALEAAVAELEARNDEIRSMTQQMWQAAKLASVGELAASIAHELNNPLATVTLRVEAALAKMPPDDPRRRGLEIVEQEAKRMSDLVANLLQFCRRGAEQSSTVDVCQELNKTLELVHHQLRKREIAVIKELDPNTPIIFADRQKLRQLFLNILSNANDATPQGGAVTLRSTPCALEGGVPGVLIEFADTGEGIPADHLDRVMDPFFSTKEEGKGTGLGLAICRRIVQEHRGMIRITSQPGGGTIVRVTLPVTTSPNQGAFAQA